MTLSKLQQEFFDLVTADGYPDMDEFEIERWIENLKRDISGMNAAELRHNIKVWKDSE